MKTKHLIRFVNSFLLLPLFTVSVPVDNIASGIKTESGAEPKVVFSQKINIATNSLVALANKQAPDPKEQILEEQAHAIDAYFKKYDMPLEGTGMTMAIAARNNDLDWRLMPAIAVRESTGGKHDCIKVANSPFGWGSCKIGFDSIEKSIDTVARNLGGNNPKTEHHYADKTTKQILQKYNPPSIVPRYAEQVMAIMDAIGPIEIALAATNTKANS